MFKNKKIKVVVVLLLIVLFAFFVLLQRKKEPESSDAFEHASFSDLRPGESTKENVFDKLGEPLATSSLGSFEVLDYQSSNPNFNREITIENDKVVFIKDIVTEKDNLKIADIENKFGKYKNSLFGPSSVNGFHLYIYPANGIAYIGHQVSGILLEVWYFEPTSLSVFKEKWASGYTDTVQPIQ